MGLGLATVGLVFLIARLVDAVSDPLIGWLSDSIPTRFGRRRVWITLGAPGLALAVLILFAPSQSVIGVGASPVQLLVGTILIYLCGTMMIVPLTAWGSDQSTSYRDRNRVTGARTGFGLVGAMVALLIIGLISQQNDGKFAEALEVLAIVGVSLVVVSVIGLWVLVPDSSLPDRDRLILFREIRSLFAEVPFRRLLLAFVLNGIANGIPAALFILFVGHVLDAESQVGPLLILYFGAAMLSVPFWIWMGKRVPKHRLWMLAVALACAVFAPAPFLGPSDVVLFAVISGVSGFLAGADLIFPPSMNADLAEQDRVRSKRSRAGLYFALWGMGNKAAMGLAVAFGFGILWLGGFSTTEENSPASLSVLAFTYGWTPILFKLAAIFMLKRLEHLVPTEDTKPLEHATS